MALLPERIKQAIQEKGKAEELIEVVMDLGRPPELRFSNSPAITLPEAVTNEEIEKISNNVGGFTSENRAGIEKTLHRISAIRNRHGQIIGLTCRVGRTMTGTVELFKDLFESGKSILLLGPPGCGKTTRLRETAQIFADELKKRVIIVDTSNEIGGHGDIPHPSIGRARRMPVIDPAQQHKVMIEAVENHTPEVIVIDEISTEEEAQAAQTIAERGVILVATAHGRDLDSLVQNPSLSNLVGGSQIVTLSDEEAKRRKSQKSIVERARDATFAVVVELISHNSIVVHHDVNTAVDQILRAGAPLNAQVRQANAPMPEKKAAPVQVKSKYSSEKPLHIYPYAVSHGQIYAVIKAFNLPAILVDTIDEANLVIALEDYANPGAKIRKLASVLNLQLETIQNNNFAEIRKAITNALDCPVEDLTEDLEMQIGLEEALKGVDIFRKTGAPIELSPRKAHVRKAQLEIIAQSGFHAEIIGNGLEQRIKLSS